MKPTYCQWNFALWSDLANKRPALFRLAVEKCAFYLRAQLL